jgi:serine/threonine-protein kinase
MIDPVRSIRSSRPSVPEHVEDAVMRALEKLPADRWSTAHEFADALAGRGAPVTNSRGGHTAPVPPQPLLEERGGFLNRRVVATAGAIAAAVAIAAIGAWYMRAPARGARATSVTFVIDPPIYEGVRQTMRDFAISPDGSTLAFVAHPFDESRARVYLRRLSAPSASPIPGTEGAADVAFSRDGKWLSVMTFGRKLLKLRVEGTTAPITLADGVDSYNGASWAGNEMIVLGNARPIRRGLGRIAATGGAVRPLTTPKSAETEHGFPLVAPDGKTVIFSDWGPGFTEDDFLGIGSLETGTFQTTPLVASRPYGVVDGRALYSLGTSIMAVPIDAKRSRVVGDPVRVLEGLTLDGHRSAALSDNGTLVYRHGQPGSRLILLDLDGRTQVLSDDEHFIWPYGNGPRFSPDGTRIAFGIWAPSGDTAAADIWTFDVKDRTFTRVTSLGNVTDPEWSIDGKRVVFATFFPRKAALWVQVADGSQAAERLLQAPDGVLFSHSSVTPDGHGVVFCRTPANGAVAGAELLYVPFIGERTPRRLTGDPMSDTCLGRVSPDGKWLAYVGMEVGTSHVFVRRFRGDGERLKVSAENGQQPTWSRDGKRLFYVSVTPGDGKASAVAATVAPDGNRLQVVHRERIAALPSTLFDVTPDGDRILAVQPSDSRVQLFVTTNWLPQLRARLAGRQ